MLHRTAHVGSLTGVLALFLAFFFVGTQAVFAQDRTSNSAHGTVTIESSFAGEALADLSFDPSESGRYIVTFTAAPQALRDGSASKTAIEDQHARFRSDLESMSTTASKRGDAAESIIHLEYRVVLVGAAITTRRDVASDISRLDYVASVIPDGEMRTLDAVSNTIIGASRARSELGLSGDGITVAVLDTGIDYTHPGLGGGFGEGYKVVGGYSFADESPDPIDRHGHGTHVAGIIAGDDGAEFLGVAPNARLLAYKVLGDGGSGRMSWVIAGIEQAVIDGADIMNLSIGGSGHPDDPVSQAIDNATIAGVLCVVAAGNDGAAYTMNSPGNARLALTVGATNNLDELATFSSRGPSSVTFENKPDIVAPGVAISSSIPGNRFAAYSGTSMATPHVAGAAALLMERHPSWAPRDLKSALVHSALDLGLSPWRQGTGRLDIMSATQATLSVHPVSLSFGNLDPAQGVTQSSQTLTVKNLDTASRSYSVSAIHGIPGATITASPATVTVSPGGTASVTVTARFDPSTLAFPSFIDVPYAGSIVIDGPSGRRVPFTVTKTPQLTIDFDVSPVTVDVIGLQSGHARAAYPGGLAAFPLSSGVYDVIIGYLLQDGDRLVRGMSVRENVSISGHHTISARTSDLKNEVRFDARSREGTALPHDYVSFTLERMSSQTAHDFSYGISLDEEPRILLSDLSSRFKIESLLTNLGGDGGDAYVIPFGRIGLNNSITMTSNSSTYRSIRTRFEVPSSVEELFFVRREIRQSTGGFTTMSSGYSTAIADRHRRTAPFERTVHYGPRPYDHFGYRYTSYEVFDSSVERLPTWDSKVRLWQAPLIEATHDDLRFYAQIDFEAPLRIQAAPLTEEVYGTGPISYDGQMWNLGSVSVHRLSNRRQGLFSGASREVIAGDITYRFFAEDGALIAEGTAPPHFLPGPFTTPAGKHTLELSLDGGFVDDVRVRATATSTFDSRLEDGLYDPDPPMITDLYLVTNGERRSALEGDGTHAIVAHVRDTYNQGGPVVRNVAEASIAVRGLLETEWTIVPSTRSGHRFEAVLSDTVAGGYYDLRILASDPAGNQLDYVVEPGFRKGVMSGNALEPVALTSPADMSFVRLHEVSEPIEFSWEQGSGVRHALRLIGASIDTMLSTTGSRLHLDVAHLFTEGQDYEWLVVSTDGFATVESERFTLRARGLTVSSDPESELPLTTALLPAYPNPFNPTTHLSFTLPHEGLVQLEVYDLLGRRVASLVNESLPGGRHERRWDATGHPSGVYVIRLTSGRQVAVQRVVLMK